MSNGLMRQSRQGDGAILGGLYFTNSIGAAGGALLSTFVLLPAIGLPGAMRFGALLNIVVAVVAFALAKTVSAIAVETKPVKGSSAIPDQRLLLSAAFITGATSFVYEMGWVRMLSPGYTPHRLR
jgi:spermidine synthase